MARLKTEQGKSMWVRLLVGYFAAILVFTGAYLGFGAIFGASITAAIGDRVANATSSWTYVTESEFDEMVQHGVLDASTLQISYLGNLDPRDAALVDKLLSSNADAQGPEADVSGDIMTETRTWSGDSPGIIAYRDLTTYHQLQGYKYPLIVMMYLIGLLVITLLFMRRPVRALDSVAEAITSPGLARGEKVELPARLASTQVELELLQMRIVQNEAAAREAEERKNELVTYLAHDIRTPLTSVLGYLELMSEEDDLPADRQRVFATRAFVKAQRLQSLVEELFEITRYNMQTIPIEREDLDVGLLCQQVAEEFYPQAQARGLTIEVDAQAGLMAHLDSSRMGRVLENLVKNALVHAAPGTSIAIGARREEELAHLGEKGQPTRYPLIISVANQGKEIAPEHLEHVFDRFYRGDAARGSQTGGAGLGLAIAKEIVEAHGGGIEVESVDGTTTFTIRL